MLVFEALDVFLFAVWFFFAGLFCEMLEHEAYEKRPLFRYPVPVFFFCPTAIALLILLVEQCYVQVLTVTCALWKLV